MNAAMVAMLAARGSWAMLSDHFVALAYRFAGWDGTVKAQTNDDTNFLGDPFAASYDVNGVTVMEVQGPLVLRASYLEKQLGLQSYNDIGAWLDDAVDRGVKGIVLNISSPGGSTTGMLELAQKVSEVASQIPVAAFTDDVAASAAYALAAGSGGIYCTASALTGSVGCVTSVLDASEFLKSIGLNFHQFASGKYKGAGNPSATMTSDHKEMFQGLVMAQADNFKDFVRKNRPNVEEASMEGQPFHGRQAVSAGFADGIVSGLGAVIDKVSSGEVEPTPKGPPRPKQPTQRDVDDTNNKLRRREKEGEDDAVDPQKTERKKGSLKDRNAMSTQDPETIWATCPEIRREFIRKGAFLAYCKRPGVPQTGIAATAPAIPQRRPQPRQQAPAGTPAAGSLEAQWAAMSAQEKSEFGSFKAWAAYTKNKHRVKIVER